MAIPTHCSKFESTKFIPRIDQDLIDDDSETDYGSESELTLEEEIGLLGPGSLADIEDYALPTPDQDDASSAVRCTSLCSSSQAQKHLHDPILAAHTPGMSICKPSTFAYLTDW